MKKRIYKTILLFLSLFMLSGCTGRKASLPEPVSQSGFFFDTFAVVTLYDLKDSSKEHIAEVFSGCFSLAEHYEALFSRTKEGSDIWRINHAEGKTTEVDPETFALVEKALEFEEMTENAVNPAIGAVSMLWDFHLDEGEEGVIPETELLASALSHTDPRSVRLDPDACRITLTDPEMRLDLGFIAKGYIADGMRDYLLSEGVTDAIINLGANVLTIGERPDGTPFKVGIQKPFGRLNETAALCEVRDASVVSSGDYERYFYREGRLYHHILDTATGFPVDTGLDSVTIFSPDSTEGDALSTSCFCMGEERAMTFLDEYNSGRGAKRKVEALFIRKDGSIAVTPGLDLSHPVYSGAATD